MLLALTWVGGRALAHPFGDRYAAQQLEVFVDPDGVHLTLTADVPDKLIDVETSGEGHPSLMDGFVHGISVRVDGQDVDLTEVARDARKDLVDTHATVMTMRWHAKVDLAGRHDLHVGNANLGNTPGWFRDVVRLAGPATVHDTNLVRLQRGRATWLDTAWAANERLRGISLDVSLPTGVPSDTLRARAPRPWTVREAWRSGPFARWRAGQVDATTASWALATAGVLGALFPPVRKRHVVSTIALAALLAWAGPAVSAGALLVGAIAASREPTVAPWAVAAGLGWAGSALPSTLAAAPVALALLAWFTLSARIPVRSPLLVLGASAAWLATRGTPW